MEGERGIFIFYFYFLGGLVEVEVIVRVGLVVGRGWMEWWTGGRLRWVAALGVHRGPWEVVVCPGYADVLRNRHARVREVAFGEILACRLLICWTLASRAVPWSLRKSRAADGVG